MNRREFIGGVAAGVVASNCPTIGQIPAGEPVELFPPSLYQVDVRCEWSIADSAWLIAAVCYDPPVVSCGKVEQGMSADYPGATIEAVKEACRKRVVEELDWMVEQQRNSPMAISPQLWESLRLERI